MVTRILLLTLVLATLVGVAGASAQQRQITGRVTSAATNEPIAGVAVSVTGTAFAAVTNAEGRYAIPAPAGTVTLAFRRIAFKRREVSVPADQNAADVVLEPDVFNLEAVVVTGQATGVERRNAAIATTNVSGEEVSRVPSPALDRALAGRVPGAIISQNSGAPGGGTQIQLRGSNTVIGNPDPLFVVDGVIYSDVALPTGLFTVTASSANRGNGELQDDPVNRLADPDSGAIRFHGEDVRSLDPRELRRRACLVPQLPSPLPGTVAHNVRFGPSLVGRTVDPIGPLELAGLSSAYAEREASRLSVGEQQRVMLARALALEPEALLLDEPTSALDEHTRAGVEATLAELAARTGVSMVVVTHDRGQANRLATRIVNLRDGRIDG